MMEIVNICPVKVKEIRDSSIYLIRIKGNLKFVSVKFKFENESFLVPLVRSYIEKKNINGKSYVYSVFKFKSIKGMKVIGYRKLNVEKNEVIK